MNIFISEPGELPIWSWSRIYNPQYGYDRYTNAVRSLDILRSRGRLVVFMLCYVTLYSRSWCYISINPTTPTSAFPKRNMRNRLRLVWTKSDGSTTLPNQAQRHRLTPYYCCCCCCGLMANTRCSAATTYLSRVGGEFFGIQHIDRSTGPFRPSEFDRVEDSHIISQQHISNGACRATFRRRKIFCWRLDASGNGGAQRRSTLRSVGYDCNGWQIMLL